jgi:hypothetical protein
MFSPHDDEHNKGPELDLEPHPHQTLVAPPGVPQPLLHQQPLSLQHVSQPDPFDEPPDQQIMQAGVLHVGVLQHLPPELQHQHGNPSDIQQHPHLVPPGIQAPPPDLHLGEQQHDEKHEQSTTSQERPSKKRRRYDNNFKAEVIEHLKIPGTKLPQVAKNFGIPENTLREWTKVKVVQSIEEARTKSCGALKANMFDPLHRLTESLMVFFDRNDRQPQHLRQPVTTKLISSKGVEARNNLLELNEIQPFLDPKEKKAIDSFMGKCACSERFSWSFSIPHLQQVEQVKCKL